jgi:hypothetical protein
MNRIYQARDMARQFVIGTIERAPNALRTLSPFALGAREGVMTGAP